MRTIEISVDTFAAIWGDRRPGENSEDEILARKFGVAQSGGKKPAPGRRRRADKGAAARNADDRAAEDRLGWNDLQYDVQLPYGFRIFHAYGKRGAQKTLYEAVAEGGRLRRVDTGELFSTLNALTASITASPVNAWENFWKYEDANGKVRPLGALRANAMVERRARHKESITRKDLGLA